MPIDLPDALSRWRCRGCGNLTRFDVTRTTRVREYVHLDLAGAPTVEDTVVMSGSVEQVVCRWCGPSAAVEVVPRPDARGAANEPAPPPPGAAPVQLAT